jgi:transposase
LEARIARLEAQVAELSRVNAELSRINAELSRINAELLERLNKNSSNSSKPPSTDAPNLKPAPPRTPSGKKRGGQPGHARAMRPLVPEDKVHEIIEHKPTACGHCGEALVGRDPKPRRHQVAELPPTRPEVVEHRLHRLTCRKCGKTTTAALPADVPAGQFGPRLSAILTLLSGGYRLGKRGVGQLALDLFGLDISLGMIAKLEKRVARATAPVVEELAEHVRGQDVHIDETGWREAGSRAWLWVVVAPLVSLFKIVRRRSAKVAKELLGKNYAGVAVCDRFRGYLWINQVQLCWAHLRRDFQAMIDRGGAGKPIGEELLGLSDILFEWWHRVRDATMARSTFQGWAARLRRDVRVQLERGAECGCAKTAATCRDLLADERWLWTFVRREGIEPTNNAAERALRHAVLWRRSSFGTQSAAGSRFVENILTIAATCRQQNRSVLETLTALLAAPSTEKPALSLLPKQTRRLHVA